MRTSLGQRVRAAARATLGIFSEDSARQAFGILQGLWPSSIGEPPTKGTRERIGAYADVPWVFALADKVASAGAAIPWTISAVRRTGEKRAVRVKGFQTGDSRLRARMRSEFKARGELVQIDDHPILDLLEAGNPMVTGVALRKLLFLYWDLEGDVYLLKERRSSGVARGLPQALWPLPPDWVRSTPTTANPSYQVSFRGWQGHIPETEVIWLRNHNPSNPYARGTGIVRALADEIETDEMAARAIRMTFLNTSRPDFIVFPKGDATMGEVERLRLQQDWEQQHQGFWRSFRARFASKEMGVYEFQATDFRRLQTVQLREFLRDEIRMSWGIPPEIMGIVAPGASRATIDRASYLFARWVLLPRLELIRAILQHRMVPEFDDRLVLDYVSPVEEDKEFALESSKASPWTLTVDEWRIMRGQDPVEGGRGRDVVAVPLNTAIVPIGTPPPPKEPTRPEPARPEPKPGDPGEPEPDDEKRLARLSTPDLYELRRIRARLDGVEERPAPLLDRIE